MELREKRKSIRYTIAYLSQEIMRIEDFLMSNRNNGKERQRVDAIYGAILSELKEDLEIFENLAKLYDI